MIPPVELHHPVKRARAVKQPASVLTTASALPKQAIKTFREVLAQTQRGEATNARDTVKMVRSSDIALKLPHFCLLLCAHHNQRNNH